MRNRIFKEHVYASFKTWARKWLWRAAMRGNAMM